MNEQRTIDDRVNHCKDCCCARSWQALGVTEFTGLSIPEHIRTFREALERICAEDPQGYFAKIANEALKARHG